MDKASVALSATEDNAAAIRELNKKLQSRTACKFVLGRITGSYTSFGNVESDGNTAVIIVFSGTSVSKLMFNGEIINNSISPLLGLLPKGSGELKITGARTANALIIG